MAGLLAGAAKMDITPLLGVSIAGLFHDRKAEDVSDPLHAKALVLDNGECRLAMVILDLIGISARYVRSHTPVLSTWKARVFPERTCYSLFRHTAHGTRPFRISTTQTQDEEYVQWMIRRVGRYSDHCQSPPGNPSASGFGAKGSLPQHLFCRRFRCAMAR